MLPSKKLHLLWQHITVYSFSLHSSCERLTSVFIAVSLSPCSLEKWPAAGTVKRLQKGRSGPCRRGRLENQTSCWTLLWTAWRGLLVHQGSWEVWLVCWLVHRADNFHSHDAHYTFDTLSERLSLGRTYSRQSQTAILPLVVTVLLVLRDSQPREQTG